MAMDSKPSKKFQEAVEAAVAEFEAAAYSRELESPDDSLQFLDALAVRCRELRDLVLALSVPEIRFEATTRQLTTSQAVDWDFLPKSLHGFDVCLGSRPEAFLARTDDNHSFLILTNLTPKGKIGTGSWIEEWGANLTVEEAKHKAMSHISLNYMERKIHDLKLSW